MTKSQAKPRARTEKADLKKPAPRNRTIQLLDSERPLLQSRLLGALPKARYASPPNGIYCGDYSRLIRALPERSVDLLILDPPYNMNKDFNGNKFARRQVEEYTAWLDEVLAQLKPLLKQTASIYICGDWYSSVSIYTAASKHFFVRNRICWEREKGRGAAGNWKNSCEDIWFCTVSDKYSFNVDAVKIRRRVIAPYRHPDGSPKDWQENAGGQFRDSHPSNIWSDISVPFWSMPENTSHPTQKSEKLLAKLILASSNPGELVFDPFLGSGSSLVVAKKLNRRYLGAEINEEYCLFAEKRLLLAEEDLRIQGFADGIFWERNTQAEQEVRKQKAKQVDEQ